MHCDSGTNRQSRTAVDEIKRITGRCAKDHGACASESLAPGKPQIATPIVDRMTKVNSAVKSQPVGYSHCTATCRQIKIRVEGHAVEPAAGSRGEQSSTVAGSNRAAFDRPSPQRPGAVCSVDDQIGGCEIERTRKVHLTNAQPIDDPQGA